MRPWVTAVEGKEVGEVVGIVEPPEAAQGGGALGGIGHALQPGHAGVELAHDLVDVTALGVAELAGVGGELLGEIAVAVALRVHEALGHAGHRGGGEGVAGGRVGGVAHGGGHLARPALRAAA